MCLEYFRLDPCHYFSSPELSWDVMLKMIGIKVTLTFQKILCSLLDWKPFKVDENAFYFILKAFFILKIFKFLLRLFGHVEKMA